MSIRNFAILSCVVCLVGCQSNGLDAPSTASGNNALTAAINHGIMMGVDSLSQSKPTPAQIKIGSDYETLPVTDKRRIAFMESAFFAQDLCDLSTQSYDPDHVWRVKTAQDLFSGQNPESDFTSRFLLNPENRHLLTYALEQGKQACDQKFDLVEPEVIRFNDPRPRF